LLISRPQRARARAAHTEDEMKTEKKTKTVETKKLKTLTLKDLEAVSGGAGDEGGTLKDGGTIVHEHV
jgi:hypothetical protein